MIKKLNSVANQKMTVSVLLLFAIFMVFACVDKADVSETAKDPEPETQSYTITVENGRISGRQDAEGKYLHDT